MITKKERKNNYLLIEYILFSLKKKKKCYSTAAGPGC